MPKAKPVPAIDPLAAIVDELGALDAELKPVAPKIARRDALRKKLREAFTEKSAELEYSVSGARFEAKLGPKGWENTVNTVKLAKVIGASVSCDCARYARFDRDSHRRSTRGLCRFGALWTAQHRHV